MKIAVFSFVVLSMLFTGCAGFDTGKINKELIKEFDAIELESKEVEQGVMIVLPTVMLFDFDKSDLKNKSRVKIKEIAEILNHPGTAKYEVLVNGYADSFGEEDYNLMLSHQRAKSVSNEFVFNGVHKSRIMAEGFGEKFPVVPNKHPDGSDNPEGRAKNRRVEVVVKTAKGS